jgi:GNAT superfamily N-acetyltransferase
MTNRNTPSPVDGGRERSRLRKMTNQILVRRGTDTDVESIAMFNMKMADETEGKTLSETAVRAGVKAVINDPAKGFYLVAEKANGVPTIIGQLLVTFEWSDWRNKYFWWVQSVYIHEAFRNRKVFSTLFDYLLNLTRAGEDICGLRLYVDKGNSLAKQVYEALGLVQTSYEVYEMEFDGV